ncbi:NHL repeat containing protein [Methylocella silvestris BL2]|uniref:NHL repeat containing protein n=1 Tax=Methylocella silvestris (strain DSM 15510 / CIP 108128 / LMG 27833 / NCIMB 13906 / BL2) TaxID=395965 RepID=B8EJE4_METSB|nr:NHL repeat-containing protein [Methylocella silvestris]ACK52636.1 NHL repeat containing protein [Methylocella silvestris BL2]
MTRLSLAPAYRRNPPPHMGRPAPMLDPAGARVILGDHVRADGLPVEVAPSPATLFGPRGLCLAPADGPLVVADTGHHRLMIWRNAPHDDNAPADFLIGQPDFFSEGRNARGDVGAATLNMPTGLSTDGETLVLADAWNHRVLIWRALPERSNQPADLVLGQADFCGGLANRGRPDAAADTLNWCYGVTLADGRLFVADTGNRRVLVWNALPERNGQPADLVLGQTNTTTRDDNASGAGAAIGMRWPHSIAAANGRILVTDAGNNRIMVWNAMPNADGAPCSFVLGQKTFETNDRNRASYIPDDRALNMPYGLVVNDNALYCADTANSRLLAYPLGSLAMDAAADGLAAQPGFSDEGDNRWRFAARDSVCWPFALAARGTTLAVADTGNNRVLLWETAP